MLTTDLFYARCVIKFGKNSDFQDNKFPSVLNSVQMYQSKFAFKTRNTINSCCTRYILIRIKTFGELKNMHTFDFSVRFSHVRPGSFNPFYIVADYSAHLCYVMRYYRRKRVVGYWFSADTIIESTTHCRRTGRVFCNPV